MTQPEGVVVPPASVRGPMIIALAFGIAFAWSVSALISNWTFSPSLRDDLLVAGLGSAVAVTGVVLYMALGAVILDIGQVQLWVDGKGIKSPAFPRFAWSEVEGVVLRKRRGLLRRHDCEMQLQLSGDAPGLDRLSLWQRLRQGRSLKQGAVVLSGRRWPMERMQDAIESHLAWHRRHSDEVQRKLVRYLGDRLPPEPGGQQVA